MIISPRATGVLDVLRKDGNHFAPIAEVFLYVPGNIGTPKRSKILYWKRTKPSPGFQMPVHEPLSRFAIVPEMTGMTTRGFTVSGNTLNNATHAWQAFDQSALTTGSFGSFNSPINGSNQYAWSMVAFPKPRMVRCWSLQFENVWSSFWIAIEGRDVASTEWTRLFESSSTSPVNHGCFGALTNPMLCSAVRILTNQSPAVRSCQFFDSVPLIPVTLTSNSSSSLGITFESEFINNNLYRCFTEQSNAYTHGTIAWYYHDGTWRSNRKRASTGNQNRFIIKFNEQKSLHGFVIGGLHSYNASYCYANCLLIEGRLLDTDAWQRLLEIDFEPSARRTRYVDFDACPAVSQLRITVQDVTRMPEATSNTSLYLPPMQVHGRQ